MGVALSKMEETEVDVQGSCSNKVNGIPLMGDLLVGSHQGLMVRLWHESDGVPVG